MRIKLRGKYYNLSFKNLRDKTINGYCESPISLDKKIVVSKQIKEELDKLEFVLHETLHGCYWDLDEEAISEGANSIAKVLFDLGARVKLPK